MRFAPFFPAFDIKNCQGCGGLFSSIHPLNGFCSGCVAESDRKATLKKAAMASHTPSSSGDFCAGCGMSGLEQIKRPFEKCSGQFKGFDILPIVNVEQRVPIQHPAPAPVVESGVEVGRLPPGAVQIIEERIKAAEARLREQAIVAAFDGRTAEEHQRDFNAAMSRALDSRESYAGIDRSVAPPAVRNAWRQPHMPNTGACPSGGGHFFPGCFHDAPCKCRCACGKMTAGPHATCDPNHPFWRRPMETSPWTFRDVSGQIQPRKGYPVVVDECESFPQWKQLAVPVIVSGLGRLNPHGALNPLECGPGIAALKLPSPRPTLDMSDWADDLDCIADEA